MAKYPKMMASLLIVAMAMAILPTAVSAIPQPVVVKGAVKYTNGTMVPDGWTVTLENLNESYPDEPWNTTTNSTWYPFNYITAGTAEGESTFLIRASDPEGKFYGEKTFTAKPLETKIVNITVYAPPPAVPLLTPPATILLAILLSMLVILLIIRGKVKR